MKKIVKILALILIAAMLFALAACNTGKKTIVVIKFGTHTSLDEINDAIVSTLKEKGYGNGQYEILERNAEFSADTASQIIAAVKNKADVVVAIATPVAQVAFNALSDDTPIVFSAVSDPVGAGLVQNLNAPEANVTGTSDEIQITMLIDVAIETGNVQGNKTLNNLGFIYNPAEANSVSNLAKIQAYCTQKGITLKTRTISAAGEMSEIAKALVPTVDAMLVTDDNTVASAMTVLADECREAIIPCYTGADSEVKDGGMLCIGINYTILGQDTADMVAQILDGKAIKDIPVKVYNKAGDLNVYVNDDYITQTGITLPASVTGNQNLVHYQDN